MLRPMRASCGLVGLALVAVVNGGCAYGELTQVLRTEVASEVDCPELEIEKKGLAYLDEDPESDQFKVSGCGVLRTYTCPQKDGLVKYGKLPCTFVEGDPDQPDMSPAADMDSASELEPLDEPLGDSADEPVEESSSDADDEGGDGDGDADEDDSWM